MLFVAEKSTVSDGRDIDTVTLDVNVRVTFCVSVTVADDEGASCVAVNVMLRETLNVFEDVSSSVSVLVIVAVTDDVVVWVNDPMVRVKVNSRE